jgi:hypothetical protein
MTAPTAWRRTEAWHRIACLRVSHRPRPRGGTGPVALRVSVEAWCGGRSRNGTAGCSPRPRC